MTFETELRDRFNRPDRLVIWAEMKAALAARDAATGRKEKAQALKAYKAAGARYRAA
jgi:hypothetical protein